MRLIHWLFIVSAALVHRRHRVHHRGRTHGSGGGARGGAARDHTRRKRQADHGRHRRSGRDRRLRLCQHHRGRHRHPRKQPSTDAEWAAVGASAAALVESANLLVVGDRAIDRQDWVKMSKALRDAGMLVLKATRRRTPWAFSQAGETLNASCDSCHQRYQRE